MEVWVEEGVEGEGQLVSGMWEDSRPGEEVSEEEVLGHEVLAKERVKVTKANVMEGQGRLRI